MDAFTLAYVEAALWSSTDDKDRPLDDNYGVEDLAPETLKQFEEDCKAFQESNAEWITTDHCLNRSYSAEERAGHDFWLTRNGHGCGFWDGDWDDAADKAMTECSEAYGGVDLYVGDDGKIYC